MANEQGKFRKYSAMAFIDPPPQDLYDLWEDSAGVVRGNRKCYENTNLTIASRRVYACQLFTNRYIKCVCVCVYARACACVCACVLPRAVERFCPLYTILANRSF